MNNTPLSRLALPFCCLALAAVLETSSANAEDEGRSHIHMLSGSGEYKSAESLPKWAAELEKAGYTCTISNRFDDECVKNLQKADCLVIFTRRWKLSEEKVQAVKDYIASGKPILGIRTASHAFQTFLELDSEVLGGTYTGHTGNGEILVRVVSENAEHPVLKGLAGDWKSSGKIYRNPPQGGGKSGAPKSSFPDDNIVLTRLIAGRVDTPGTWVRTNKGGQRVFYTSLGYTHDFDDPNFKRLINNALAWCLDSK